MRTSKTAFIFLLFIFIYSNEALPLTICADGGGTCTDTGSAKSCYINLANWQYYCSGGSYNGTLHNSAACDQAALSKCGCGDTDAGGPCAACGYQSFRLAGSCYSNTACTNACSGVPEFPEKMGFLASASTLLMFFVFHWSQQRRSVSV